MNFFPDILFWWVITSSTGGFLTKLSSCLVSSTVRHIYFSQEVRSEADLVFNFYHCRLLLMKRSGRAGNSYETILFGMSIKMKCKSQKWKHTIFNSILITCLHNQGNTRNICFKVLIIQFLLNSPGCCSPRARRPACFPGSGCSGAAPSSSPATLAQPSGASPRQPCTR